MFHLAPHCPCSQTLVADPFRVMQEQELVYGYGRQVCAPATAHGRTSASAYSRPCRLRTLGILMPHAPNAFSRWEEIVARAVAPSPNADS